MNSCSTKYKPTAKNINNNLILSKSIKNRKHIDNYNDNIINIILTHDINTNKNLLDSIGKFNYKIHLDHVSKSCEKRDLSDLYQLLYDEELYNYITNPTSNNIFEYNNRKYTYINIDDDTIRTIHSEEYNFIIFNKESSTYIQSINRLPFNKYFFIDNYKVSIITIEDNKTKKYMKNRITCNNNYFIFYEYKITEVILYGFNRIDELYSSLNSSDSYVFELYDNILKINVNPDLIIEYYSNDQVKSRNLNLYKDVDGSGNSITEYRNNSIFLIPTNDNYNVLFINKNIISIEDLALTFKIKIKYKKNNFNYIFECTKESDDVINPIIITNDELELLNNVNADLSITDFNLNDKPARKYRIDELSKEGIKIDNISLSTLQGIFMED